MKIFIITLLILQLFFLYTTTNVTIICYIYMAYTKKDIYNSYKYLININPAEAGSSMVKVNYDKTWLILKMKSIIDDFISSLTNTLDCLKLDTSSKIKNISSLEKILKEKSVKEISTKEQFL